MHSMGFSFEDVVVFMPMSINKDTGRAGSGLTTREDVNLDRERVSSTGGKCSFRQ